MDHARAKSIFEEIQARPYRLALRAGEPAANCYYKGIELLQRLGILGYPVRGRVGETRWHAGILPAEILALFPHDLLLTHFFVEAEVDGAWRVLDASFPPALARYGFPIGAWENGGTCFPITRLYTLEEGKRRDFFAKGEAGFAALDAWFAAHV